MSDRDNTGAIWKNEKREKDTHPHFTGNATIDGVDYWVSAWKRDDDARENAPLLKFSFKVKEDRPKPQQAEAVDIEDDLPF